MNIMNKIIAVFSFIFLLQSVNAAVVSNQDSIPVVYSLAELEASPKDGKVNLRIHSILFRLGFRDLDTNYQGNIQFLDSLVQLIRGTDEIKSIEIGIHFAKSGIEPEYLSDKLFFMYEGIIDYLVKKGVDEGLLSGEQYYNYHPLLDIDCKKLEGEEKKKCISDDYRYNRRVEFIFDFDTN